MALDDSNKEVFMRDLDAAADALQAWFKTQDLDRADASSVMTMVMARQMTDMTKDLARLAFAIELYCISLQQSVLACLTPPQTNSGRFSHTSPTKTTIFKSKPSQGPGNQPPLK